MSRPPHSPPRRPALPFELDGSEVHGAIFMTAGRWMLVGTDELVHHTFEELKTRKHGPDPIRTAIGPAFLRMLN